MWWDLMRLFPVWYKSSSTNGWGSGAALADFFGTPFSSGPFPQKIMRLGPGFSRPRKKCDVCGRSAPADHHHRTKVPHSETTRRRDLVDAYRALHGEWCPGWQVEAHPAYDLTADHIVPRSLGGERGPLRVLCRACNARRGNQAYHRGRSESMAGTVIVYPFRIGRVSRGIESGCIVTSSGTRYGCLCRTTPQAAVLRVYRSTDKGGFLVCVCSTLVLRGGHGSRRCPPTTITVERSQVRSGNVDHGTFTIQDGHRRSVQCRFLGSAVAITYPGRGSDSRLGRGLLTVDSLWGQCSIFSPLRVQRLTKLGFQQTR